MQQIFGKQGGKMDDIWKYFIRYYETGDEKWFEKFWNEIKNYIEYKTRSFGLAQEKDDVKQEVGEQIIKSIDNYDKDRPPEPYVITIILNAIISYKKEKNRGKRKINQDAISLNKKAGMGKEDGEMGELIANGENIEKQFAAKQDLSRATNLIKKELSNMEYEIWKENMKTYNFQYNQIQKVADETGYSYKQVDNALQRIEKKIKWVKRVIECESE